MKARKLSSQVLAILLTFDAASFSRRGAAQDRQADYERVTATQSSGGDTGLFDVYSAYTLLRHKLAVSGFRNNNDPILKISIRPIS